MVAFQFETVLDSGPGSYLTGITDLDIALRPDGPVLYAASGPSGGISAYRLTATGPQFLDRDPFAPGQIQATPGRLEELELNGATVLVALGRHDATPDCFDLNASGQIVGTDQLTAQGGFPSAIVTMATAQAGSKTYAYVSHFDVMGLSVYEIAPSGQFIPVGTPNPPGSGVQGIDLAAIESVEIDGETFLVTVSAAKHTITSYRIGGDGLPQQVSVYDDDGGLGINAPSGLVPVSVAGVQYLVVAAAGSGSLSVLELQPNGQMRATDHVIDELGTRFQAVSALEAVTVDGQVYLVAGGADDGLSLFQLLPGGRLIHLASLADSAETALSNVTALALRVEDGVLHVFASGEGELGITHLTVDLGPLGGTTVGTTVKDTINGTAGRDVISGEDGNDVLRGLDGDDVLIDGAGSDKLVGGDGADTFVFLADGVRDTVQDFELGVDRLDLSGLGLIRSLSQLTIDSTTWGAKVFYGTEEVRLYSHDGMPLEASDFTLADFIDLSHFPVDAFTAGGLIEGSAGNDTLGGGSSGDTVNGMGGDDWLDGKSGNDTLRGNDGNDTLWGETGNDLLEGGDGADLLRGGAFQDILWGEAGNDEIHGDAGFDVLRGGSGNDTLYGGFQHDTLWGGTENDRLYADGGNDVAYGENGNDRLEGGEGHDQLYGGAGNDTLIGGAQNDTLVGGAGDDVLRGAWQNDALYGREGDDALYGGSDADRLYGDEGNDTLWGETGNDTLEGGAGADVFVFTDGFGQDVITDFDAASSAEKIDLSGLSAITSFADLTANHLSQAGGNAVIQAPGGYRITLLGVGTGDLGADDFIF